MDDESKHRREIAVRAVFLGDDAGIRLTFNISPRPVTISLTDIIDASLGE